MIVLDWKMEHEYSMLPLRNSLSLSGAFVANLDLDLGFFLLPLSRVPEGNPRCENMVSRHELNAINPRIQL